MWQDSNLRRSQQWETPLGRFTPCRLPLRRSTAELHTITRHWKLSRQPSGLRSGRHSCRGRIAGHPASFSVGFSAPSLERWRHTRCPRFRPQVDDRVCTRFRGRRAHALSIQVPATHRGYDCRSLLMRQDSNLQPAGLESAALPVELRTKGGRQWRSSPYARYEIVGSVALAAGVSGVHQPSGWLHRDHFPT